jgi:membrane protein DedA with SNARE-associated domain
VPLWLHSIGEWVANLITLADTPGHDWLAALIILVWTFIEGETIVIIMGYFAQDNIPHLWVVIVAAFLGSLAGDQTWFFVGRRRGRAIIAKRPFFQQKAEKVYRMLHRHQYWLILGFRFLYGLRNITPFALGMSEVRTRNFVTLNVIGAAIWAVTFSLAGYLFGKAADSFASHLKLPILGGFVGVILVVWIIRTILRIRRDRLARRAAQPAAVRSDGQ